MSQKASSDPSRLVGLDTLRFIAAAVVTMSHVGDPPLTAGLQRTHPIAWFISASYGVWCNGPAAVIIFFLISGLCIHYPCIDEAPNWPKYFIRRYIRIGIPLVASIGFCYLVGMTYLGLSETILWSLQCELIYYTLYPALLIARRRFGWKPLIAASFVAAWVVVAILNPRAAMYPKFGWQANWAVAMPCWLLGCLLAERMRDKPPKVCQKIWYWRAAVFLGSCVSLILRFHSPIGSPWTLNPFAFIVYFWLLEELPHLAATNVPKWTERLGLFSYSIYLVHLGAWELFKKHYTIQLGPLLNWASLMIAVLIVSYLFYLAVEAPSHKLARYLASLVGPKKQPKEAPPTVAPAA